VLPTGELRADESSSPGRILADGFPVAACSAAPETRAVDTAPRDRTKVLILPSTIRD
jgi:hypothetical protein